MRALVVGGGCRALALARELVAEGHAVRAVTRRPERRAAIEAAGAECWIGDPDVVGTLRYALDNVTVLLWLLGTASGDAAHTAELHGPRLRMLLEKTTDTTVRGVVYENRGTVDPAVLAVGAEEVRRAHRVNEIPYALLDAHPADRDAWLAAARTAIGSLLGPRRLTRPAVSDDVDTVRAAFDAFARRDAQGLTGLLDPDAELVTATPRRRVARLLRYEGHGGLQRLLDEVEADWAFYRVTLLEARSLAPGVVLAEGTVVVSGDDGGFGTPAAWIVTVTGGRISRVEPYLSRHALQERLAAGYARGYP